MRAAAEARGTSISDLVRSLVSRELAPAEAGLVPTSNSTSGRPSIGQGIFWEVGQTSFDAQRANGTIVTASYTH